MLSQQHWPPSTSRRGTNMEGKLDPCEPRDIPEPALDLMLLAKTDPKSIRFADAMDSLAASYDVKPVPFSVGTTLSKRGENTGSALILSFAKHVGLTKGEALALFGEHYASVRAEPEGTSHSNIRSFMAGGFACVSFPEGLAIINKADTDSGGDSDSGDEAAGGAAEDAVLAELGHVLPALKPPAGSYRPVRRVNLGAGNALLYMSGHVPWANGEYLYIGKVGAAFTKEEGAAAAEICALQLLSRLRHACDGDFSKVRAVVRLGVHVNCTDDFGEQTFVGNGASDLLVKVFGDERGSHSRAALGTNALPRGVCVEIEAIFEIASSL